MTSMANIKFVGNTIKIDKEATMAYTYILDPIENIDDEIDLPYAYSTCSHAIV